MMPVYKINLTLPSSWPVECCFVTRGIQCPESSEAVVIGVCLLDHREVIPTCEFHGFIHMSKLRLSRFPIMCHFGGCPLSPMVIFTDREGNVYP